MAAFQNFRPLVPDEECPPVNNTMSVDGGTTYADGGVSFRHRSQQQPNESHFSVLSYIGNFEQTDSDVVDQEEISEAQESGILIRFVEGRDTMYGAPNACSTGLSLLQPEILDTVNSFLSKTMKDLADRDTASGFPGFSTTAVSPISQYTINSSSSSESLSQRSLLPGTARNKNRREAAVGMCSSDDSSSPRARNLQEHRLSDGKFIESHLSQYPCSAEASGESHLSQYPFGSYGSSASRLTQYPMSDASGLIQDFDSLIHGSAGGDIRASQLTVVDAFPGVATSTALPQFTVIDAFVGDTETGGSKQRGDLAELPQFTVVDTFVGGSVPQNVAQHKSSGQHWAKAQIEVVDAVVGSRGRGDNTRDDRLVIAECKTLEAGDEDELRLERPPLYPLPSVETYKSQATASVGGLQMASGLKTYTYDEPESGDLQQIAVSSTATPAVSSFTTLPESGDCQLFATTSEAKSMRFRASPQLMSGDTTHDVADSAAKLSDLPASQQLMSGDVPLTSASLISYPLSSSQSQVNAASHANFPDPHALQQPLVSDVSHSNSTCGSQLAPSSVQSAKVDLPSSVDSSQRATEAGHVPHEASQLLPPRIPAVQDLDLQRSLAEIHQKQVWLQLQFDQEMSELQKTISPPQSEKPVLFAKPMDNVLSGYQNVPWMTVEAAKAQRTSDLTSSIVGPPFDVNRMENSLRLSMDVLQTSIGDTLIHTGRAPLGSSTPITKEEKLKLRRLQAMQTIQDSEERSDSGRASRASTAASADTETGKVETKSGSDIEYIPAEERHRLLEPNGSESFVKDRAGDGEHDGRVSDDASDGLPHNLRNVIYEAAETEECKRTTQNRSKGVGAELDLSSGPKSRDGVVCEKVEDQRNVELEWAEKLSGRGSRTASSSGCSLGDSAPDFKASADPGRSPLICDNLLNQSGSFEDLQLRFQRREPLGEERQDVKQSPQILTKLVVVEGDYDGLRNSEERDSCSEGSDVEKVHQLYLSCLEDEEEPGMSEEENVKMEEKNREEKEGEEKDEEGKKDEEKEGAKGKHEEEPNDRSKNLTQISESREDLRSKFLPCRSLYDVEQKSDVRPVGHGGSAVVFSDSDSLTSSLPRSSLSGSDIEDGLSEDVKRILARYGRRFSNLKSDEYAEKSNAEIKYKLSELDQMENTPSVNVQEKMFGKSEDETSGGEEPGFSNRNPKSYSLRSGDFRALPAKLSRLYSDNAEKSFPRNESSLCASTSKKTVDQTAESSSESSDDTLGRRVNNLLTKTDRVLGKQSEVAKSPSRRSSVGSSQTGSVDYGVLQKDLDELEMSLDSMKKGDFIVSGHPESSMSRTNKQASTQLASGAEGSERGLHLLLASGLIPVNLALDMMHGCTDDLSDDGGPNVSSVDHGQLDISESARDSVRIGRNEDTLDDRSEFSNEAGTRLEENQHISDALTLERAITTSFSASQSFLTDRGKSKTLEATMEDWSQNHISSFPEMSLQVDDDGRSRSRGSFQENVTTQRGSSNGSKFIDVSQNSRFRDSVEANVTIGRGSNSFRESVTKNVTADDVGQSSEKKTVGGATDEKDNQSSGFSGSGSLARSDLSLGFRVAKVDRRNESSLKTSTGDQPLISTGWSGKSLRLIQGGLSPTEHPVTNQSEAKRNLQVKESIDKKDLCFAGSSDSVRSNRFEEREVKEDARTTVNSMLGPIGHLNFRSDQADGAPYEGVSNSINAGFLPNQLKHLVRNSDITLLQQRTSHPDGDLSDVQRRYDDSDIENLSLNETSFAESGINNNENNFRATPVSDIHELDSFEVDTEPISAVTIHRAKPKHGRAEFTGQPIGNSDCESAEGEWTEQFLDEVEPDACYISESMLDDRFSPSDNAELSSGFIISPLRKHSPFRASESVQLLLAAQLNRAKMSSCETVHSSSKHPVAGGMHHERVFSSSRDLDNISGDSSGTLVVNDSVAADETLKLVRESSAKERSRLESDNYYPSDHDSQLNSNEEQSASSAMQHTSLTTVTSLRDSTDCENNLILEFPTRCDVRQPSTSPTIVPYRPLNSRDVYYVDSGTDDGSVSAGHSEATVESTHTGSDDARAPHFPVEVLGTRSDAPMDAMRSIKTMLPSYVSRPTDLSTIEELSVVQTSHSDRQMSDSSAISKPNNHLMEKSRKKEFEQSLEKTKNWVNGISSSLPDMCTPSKVHRDSLCSLSDSSIPSVSRAGQTTALPHKKPASGKPLSGLGQQIRKAGDEVDVSSLMSRVNEMSGKQPRSWVGERASEGVAVSAAVLDISTDRSPLLSQAIEENRLPPCVEISADPYSALNSEPYIMPTFGSNRDTSEMRSAYFEERTVDPMLKPEDHLESIMSSAALDHFVSDRFAGRFDSHYGLMPGVQSIVEQYADDRDARRKREVEEELNKTHTVHESPFRSSKDLSEAAAEDSKQCWERTDLLPSKSLDSSLQMTSLNESSMNRLSKSRSDTLPGQAAEVLIENSDNLPPSSSSRISKDVFVSRLWEKFHESGTCSSSESDSSSRRAEASALQLVSLVNNPVRHLVKHLQREREENREASDTRLDRSASHSRVEEGTSLRSADSYQTYVMETGRPWDLAREAAAGKDGERPSGTHNTHGGTSRKGAGDQSPILTRLSRGGGMGLGLNGAGEKSSSDDEHDERRRKLIHSDFGKGEILRKLLEKEDKEKRKQEEGRGTSSRHQQQKVSKRAWIIQDEVLPVVPENETIDSVTSEFTSSSVDESGKVVTRTTKRHLPGDPKLLKLQQKIARQKEKYKQAYFREHRRKEKISQLEMLYLMKQNESGVEPTNIGSSLESFSQAPSSFGFDSTPRNMTSDNSAFCFSCSETDGSGACICVQLKSKHPALQKLLPEDIAHGIKMRKSSPTKKGVGKSGPLIALELREVDYLEDDRVQKDDLVRSKRVHASHSRISSLPRRSEKAALTKSSPKKVSHASPDIKTPSFMVPKDSSYASGRHDPHSDAQRKLKSKSVDFGMNFPTPRHVTRKSSRSKGVQTTPRLEDSAPPLDARSCVSERRSYRGSRPYDVGVISIPVKGRVKVKATHASPHASHGTFIAESRDHEWHLQTRSKVKSSSHKIRPRKSFPRGIAWFIPLKKDASSHKSQLPSQYTNLYEMRSETTHYTHTGHDIYDKENAFHLDQSGATIVKESSIDLMGKRTTHKESAAAAVLGENVKNFQKLLTSSEVGPKATEGFVMAKGERFSPSLQELFRSNMQAFISRSREREKHVALRAEERRIQELHAKERLQLFGSVSRGSSVLHADPGCERLFKPRKRWFTKQQMKMMTNRRYRNLPEVTKMVEQRQKTERFQANRQRVQMFKQKILSHVLSEKNRRTAA